MRYGRQFWAALCGISIGAGVAGLAHQALAAAPATGAAAGCNPDGDLRYLCGPVNAEDLIRLGNTRWLVASGLDGPLNGGAPARGHLYLVDHEAKSFIDWFPGSAPAFRQDNTLFRECPGPLDVNSFSAHGLALREQSAGRYRLYVTGHGAREAIEVFDVDASGARPAITWTGCVVLPAKVSANSVAILPDGGFLTTQFMDRSAPLQQAFGDITSGKVQGQLYEWHPGGKVEPVAGTQMSGPNGLVVSPDGNTIFVAGYGSHDVVRFQRSGGNQRRDVVKMEITPDNLRWNDAGKVLAAGSVHGVQGRCATPPCAPPWAVMEIDPQTLAVRKVVSGDRLTGMMGVTAAVQVGREVWVGTYSGSRIGYVPIP